MAVGTTAALIALHGIQVCDYCKQKHYTHSKFCKSCGAEYPATRITIHSDEQKISKASAG